MKKSWLGVMALMAFVWGSSSALAWNARGHHIVAAIAYQSLDSATQQAVTAALKHHPFYETTWRQAQPEGVSEGLYLFMRAAVWPDDVRSGPHRAQYHQGNWHYINLPFAHVEQPEMATKPPEFPSIVTAMSHNVMTVRHSSTPADKAIALSWLLHLVGDAHQPLHAAGFFSRAFPESDRGGNNFFVQPPGRQPVNLHAYWDGALGSSKVLRTAVNRAIELRAAHPRESIPEVGTMDRTRWLLESFELAKDQAYQGGRLPGGQEGSEISPLPAEYGQQVKAVCERRAALAGYRLATLLQDLM
jgi:hypothetical protein